MFFGDSITAHWDVSEIVKGAECLNRGIGGQTTLQMRMRFKRDVLALDADVVVILGGTNDLGAGIPHARIASNLLTMAERAKRQGMRVFMGTVPQSDALNRMLVGFPRIDYALRPELLEDGVHPNKAGYEAMRETARRAIEREVHF